MPSTRRFPAMDAVRGVAVMGILLMNIIGFSMPEAAALAPDVWLPDSPANLPVWIANFMLIDNKMRGLFSMLFGASMAIIIANEERAGRSGLERHLRRAFWLLLFGLIHHYLIWDGDVLTLYAASGCLAALFHRLAPRRLIALALLAFVAHAALWASLLATDLEVERRSLLPGASAALITQAEETRQAWGAPGSEAVREQIDTHRAGYRRILHERAVEDAGQPLRLIWLFGFETLGLMWLGMALFKSGMLSGRWRAASYARLAGKAYAFSLPGMALLTLWCAQRGWDAFACSVASILWSIPFREAMVVGHAALILWLFKTTQAVPLWARIRAVGQTALTNYLGTSLVMTSLFYGYGLGLYGHVGRAPAYLFCFAAWIVMLIWSPWWMARFRQGPLEWLWRCLTEIKALPIARERTAELHSPPAQTGASPRARRS